MPLDLRSGLTFDAFVESGINGVFFKPSFKSWPISKEARKDAEEVSLFITNVLNRLAPEIQKPLIEANQWLLDIFWWEPRVIGYKTEHDAFYISDIKHKAQKLVLLGVLSVSQ